MLILLICKLGQSLLQEIFIRTANIFMNKSLSSFVLFSIFLCRNAMLADEN